MATIYDVAKYAQVSPATVSNAFNRPNQMKPETRERILAAATDLGYRPNVNAQALAKGKTSIVGLLLSDIRQPYASNLTRGIEDVLVEAGYMPMIASTDGDTERTLTLIDKLRSYGAGGFILMPAQYGAPESILDKLQALQESGIGCLVAGQDIDTDRISYVSIRGQESAKVLTNHLIQLGHRRIAYLGSYFSRGLAIQRWLGYQQAFLSAGLPLDPKLWIEAEQTPSHSFQGVEKLMALSDPPTAILAMNDIYARGVIDYITTHNIRVPQDLSIVTYDYQALAQRVTPALTSLVISAYDVGKKSAELFLELEAASKPEPRAIFMPYQLADRGSTAPPSTL